MKHKLQTFSDFAATLLPHETAWLRSVHQFADQDKLNILERLDYNCRHIHHPVPFDPSIDKRKYSGLKSWISERLSENDADAQFEWMSLMERKIVTDAIAPEDERALLRALRKVRPTDYFFTKFYELIQAFRHFLLIRFRNKEHRQTDLYLKTHREAWVRARKVYEQLHEVTLDVVQQYQTGSGQSEQWGRWLAEVFYDETLDGQNRYFALIRLIFVHINYERLSVLLEKFEMQDRIFEQGVFYSRRILLNYYSQRLLLHSKLKDYDTAAYYGYLSIRGRNSDYLFYVNNLAAVLLRGKKYEQALQLMKSAHNDAKTTRNYYNRIGFVALYMRCLMYNGQSKNAEGYGAAFLKAYSKEILEYRWRLFFTNYLGALFQQRKHGRLLTVARQYDLRNRDRANVHKSSYLPLIPWYCRLAELMENGRVMNDVCEEMARFIKALPPDSERHAQVWAFVQEAEAQFPGLHTRVNARLKLLE